MCQIRYSWIARNPQVSTGQASNCPLIALALQVKSKQKLDESLSKKKRRSIQGSLQNQRRLSGQPTTIMRPDSSPSKKVTNMQALSGPAENYRKNSQCKKTELPVSSVVEKKSLEELIGRHFVLSI